MRGSSDVFAANLRGLREAAGMTQQQLADATGFTRELISAVENRRAPLSLQLSIACARVLKNPIIAEQDGELFVVAKSDRTPGGDRDRAIPDDEELHDLSDAEHNLNVMQQAADVVQAIQRLVTSPLLLRRDSELSDALRVAKYKELYELDWAVRGRLREGQKTHPHLVEKGLQLALAERPGAMRGSDYVDEVA